MPVNRRNGRKFSEPPDGLPDALGRDLLGRKLGHRLDARQSVPDLHQPLGVGADQVGELSFGGKDIRTCFARSFPGRVRRDAVFVCSSCRKSRSRIERGLNEPGARLR
jgi:hypothetical protein